MNRALLVKQAISCSNGCCHQWHRVTHFSTPFFFNSESRDVPTYPSHIPPHKINLFWYSMTLTRKIVFIYSGEISCVSIHVHCPFSRAQWLQRAALIRTEGVDLLLIHTSFTVFNVHAMLVLPKYGYFSETLCNSHVEKSSTNPS